MNLRKDSPAIEALLYHAQKAGILPITSTCNMSCAFCSNRYNPPTCEIVTIPPRDLSDIEDSMPWLGSVLGPIVIGESVTRINEGEPFTHPKIMDILDLVRKTYPSRVIRVTTNCSLLDREIIERLAELDVELTVSLNTVSKRKEVMGDGNPEKTLGNVALLKGRVRFDGSVVALPFLTGWDDLSETVDFLEKSGAETIRLLCPGFSSLHPLAKHVGDEMWAEVYSFVASLKKKRPVPILVEPPLLKDTLPIVESVLPMTPAKKCGIEPLDIIRKVNGIETFSRLDAFQMVRDERNPRVVVEREGGLYDFTLTKEKFKPSGLVMYEDLDYSSFTAWEKKSGVNRGRKAVILTSRLAKPILESALSQRGLFLPVVAVKSRYFGGNIQAGGLLTCQDFEAALHDYLADENREKPDLVTVPGRAFDPWGRDLEGISYRRLQERIGIQVLLAE